MPPPDQPSIIAVLSKSRNRRAFAERLSKNNSRALWCGSLGGAAPACIVSGAGHLFDTSRGNLCHFRHGFWGQGNLTENPG